MTDITTANWEIPSNSGRAHVSAVLDDVETGAEDNTLYFVVNAEARRFDRRGNGELVEQYGVVLLDVAVSWRKLVNNVAVIQSWLEQPREMELDFSASPQERCSLSFRKMDAVISTIYKPVCMFKYKAFLQQHEIGFVVDESCIRIFLEGLNRTAGVVRQVLQGE